jgi:hypothetical protein
VGSKYMDNNYKYGVRATLIAMLVMIGIPIIICVVYGVWPTLSSVISAAGPLLAIFVPTAIAEQLSMVPVAGTTAYLNSILGNVMNIKFPCYLSAINKAKANPGTELADVLGMIAVTVSGMVTVVIIAIGVMLLVPMKPILTSDTVTTATQYIMPALYGSMGISAFIGTTAGDYNAPKKPLIAVICLVLVFGFSIFVTSIADYTGYAMLIMLVVTLIVAYILYKKGIVKLYKKEKQEL